MGMFSEADLPELIRRGLLTHEQVYGKPTPSEQENRLAWSEKKFQGRVEKLAKERGWLPYHTWMSVRSQAGFPDLVIVRGDRLIFAELKAQKGKLTADQEKWRESLLGAGVTYYVWRPADWSSIEAVLS